MRRKRGNSNKRKNGHLKQIYINYRAILRIILGWKVQEDWVYWHDDNRSDDKTWYGFLPWFIHCFTKWGRKIDERNEEPPASRWDTSLRIWMEWRQFFGSHVKNTQSRSSFHSSSFNSEIRTGPKKLVRSHTDCLKHVLDMYVSHSSLTKPFHLFLTGFCS